MLLFLLVGCHTEEAVLENLSEHNANLVLVALFDHSIHARKISLKGRQGTSYQVMVKKSQYVEALKILLESDLPTEESLSLKDVFPPGQSGVIPTKSEEIARLTLAQKGEVENMLKSLPLVMSAKVVINLDNPSIFKDPPKKTASIALIVREKDADFQKLNDEVKHLAKAALGPIDLEDISVVIKPYYSSWQFQEKHDLAKEKPIPSLNIWLFSIVSLLFLVATFGLYRVYSLKKTLKTLTNKAA